MYSVSSKKSILPDPFTSTALKIASASLLAIIGFNVACCAVVAEMDMYWKREVTVAVAVADLHRIAGLGTTNEKELPASSEKRKKHICG